MTSKNQKERAQKTIPGGTKKKGELLRPSGDLIRIGSKIAIQTINMFLSRTLSLLNYQHKLPQLLTSTIRKHTWTIRNTMECDATAWLVDFPNPYSHRHRGRNPFAQHLNYPKINSSTKDYPKTTLIFFAFYRTLRKCVKALSENYPTKYGNLFWLSETRKKLSGSFPGL